MPIYKMSMDAARWGAVFPGAFVPVLTLEGKCLRGRAKPAHLVGHLPTGIGDLANNVPALRLALTSYVNKPREQVDVRLVMARAVSYRMSRAGIEGLPFHSTFLVDGEDITHQVDTHRVFEALSTTLQRAGGDIGLLMTAASAMTVFERIIRDSYDIMHAPGPCGLPGGYPICVHAQGVEIALPHQVSMHHALQINQAGLYLDGIENIEEDGTVVFTDEAMMFYRDILGYECKRLPAPINVGKRMQA